MEKKNLQRLIQKYLNGDCNAEEIAVVHQWYSSFEHDPNPLDILTAEQQQQLKHRLITRIRANVAESVQAEQSRRNPRTLLYTLSGIAAAIILVLGITFLNVDHSAKQVTVAQDMVIANMTKTIHKLVLDDGSIVWLNPHSKIVYPKKFAKNNREVRMIGEAFFEVTHDEKRPFIIYSGDVITRVWGTSFRVKAYENIPVEVSVVTGRVSVKLQKKDDSEIMLLPNQKATYVKNNNLLKRDAEKRTSAIRIWQKATMSFDNATIEEVIKVLNKQFGVQIRARDTNLLGYVLKADFSDQSLPSILEMLERSLDVEYEINDQEIILHTKSIN